MENLMEIKNEIEDEEMMDIPSLIVKFEQNDDQEENQNLTRQENDEILDPKNTNLHPSSFLSSLVAPPQEKDDEIVQVFSCGICDEDTFQNVGSLNQHRAGHGTKYNCSYCRKKCEFFFTNCNGILFCVDFYLFYRRIQSCFVIQSSSKKGSS